MKSIGEIKNYLKESYKIFNNLEKAHNFNEGYIEALNDFKLVTPIDYRVLRNYNNSDLYESLKGEVTK